MGLSCGCTNIRDERDTDIRIPALALCSAFPFKNYKLQIAIQSPRTYNPEFGFNISKQCSHHTEFPHNQDHYEHRWELSKSKNVIWNPMEYRPSWTYRGKAEGKSPSTDVREIHPVEILRNPDLDQNKKQISNISTSNVPSEIITVLTKFMATKDADVRAIATKLMTEVVIPAANHDARIRTLSLSSLKQINKSNPELDTFSDIISREHKSSPLRSNTLETWCSSNSDFQEQQILTRTSVEYPTEKFHSSVNSEIASEWKAELEEQEVLDFSKQQFEKNRRLSVEASWMLANLPPLTKTLRGIPAHSRENIASSINSSVCTPDFDKSELYVEREDEQVLPNISEDEMSEEDLGSITMDIDQLEQSINEVSFRIKNLRSESVNILTWDHSDFKQDYDSDGDDAPSFLKLEKKINQLERQKSEFESKRREAVIRLQNKMLKGMKSIVHEKLLPKVVEPIPLTPSAPVFNIPPDKSRTVSNPAGKNIERCYLFETEQDDASMHV